MGTTGYFAACLQSLIAKAQALLWCSRIRDNVGLRAYKKDKGSAFPIWQKGKARLQLSEYPMWAEKVIGAS